MAKRTEAEINYIRELWNNGLEGRKLSTIAIATEAAKHFKDDSITPEVVHALRSRYENFNYRESPVPTGSAKKPKRPKPIPRGTSTLLHFHP